MIKDIKEVLHLYIGQWCIADGNRFKLAGLTFSEGGTLAYTGRYNGGIPEAWWVENCDFKIELRKLSSMTEEEKREYHKLFSGMESVNILPEIRAGRLINHFLNAKSPHVVVWLLSKGFDLFQLLDNNLAIEKK